jgi:hypothetical protein
MGRNKYTTESFISRASEVHNNFYDYSRLVYVKSSEKIIITCPVHGDFEQRAENHLQGTKCSKCGNIDKGKNPTSNTEDFIIKAIKIHSFKYGYSKVNYLNNSSKVIIICPIHGDFMQKPNGHLNGHGCSKCGKESHWRKSDYIKKAKGRICTFYTIHCFNDSESFYKVGITMKSIKKRYGGIDSMPYTYEIISEIFGEAGFIWDLELKEKRKLKEFKYKPSIYFKGSKTECFTQYKS